MVGGSSQSAKPWLMHWTGRDEPGLCARVRSCKGAIDANRFKAQVRSTVSSGLEQLRRPNNAAFCS